MKNKIEKNIIVYQGKNGAIELKGDFNKETLWANLNQISDLFDTDKSGISRHIRNIFKTKELDRRGTVAKIATVQTEGRRNIIRDIEFYNLDVILSVGYRVNSKQATLFRQWATKILREHITRGFTINTKVIKTNYAEFQKAIENLRHLLPAGSSIDQASVLELVSAFAETWLSLEAYDTDTLVSRGTTKKSVDLSVDLLSGALSKFKNDLLKKKMATDIFGLERQGGSVNGVVGSVMQAFGGKEFYPTVEEKAAHLLYFMVKDHPFVDGNKRCGAFAFVWFLRKAGALHLDRITPAALTALTIFIAESDPIQKEKMIRVVLQLLKA